MIQLRPYAYRVSSFKKSYWNEECKEYFLQPFKREIEKENWNKNHKDRLLGGSIMQYRT